MAGSHIAIPTILKIGKGTLNNLGKYIAGAGMKNAVIYFGNGLIDMFGQQVMDSLKEENVTVVEYRELDSTNIEDIIRLAFDIDAKAQVIVGIGGGKVIDVTEVMDAGANIIVAGSAVFKGDISENVERFLDVLKE